MATKNPIVSPCHNAKIGFTLYDGVQIGSCLECYRDVLRINPETGVEEWLENKSPWTKDSLRPVER